MHTQEGQLRHPAFLGLRGDKPAKDVQTLAVADMASTDPPNAKTAGIVLTSPEKVLFPEAGVTKAALARYLLAAADRMLPHVTGRLISLVRCPDGVGGDRFFQRHPTKGMPPALLAVPVEEADGKSANYMMIEDAAGLVAAAQIGAVELHVWGSHYETLERPDRLVFDLDPDSGVTFADVRAAARDVRKLLQGAGLESFPLVTGGKGIHVVVPLEARRDWDEVKAFAKGVAMRLAATEPERFTATMSKAKRKGRIFIDWLRNERSATAVAPYSPRANPRASVAVPVSWAELGRVARADVFTIASVERRLRQQTVDPWAGYLALRQRIAAKAFALFT